MESRYARQLLLPEIGAEGQRRLSDARVLIVGAGGLGSPVAAYLAGAGVGTIGIVDDDVVSVSNLQRQVLYDEGMVGRAKALCAKERLSALNSGIVVNACNERLTPDNAGRLIGGYDIVVDGTDNFAVRYVISDTCHAQGKPMVYGAVCAFEGQVCVLCKGHATYRTLYPDEAAPAMPYCGKEVVGVTPAVVGSVQAAQVLQLICSYGEPLIDRLWSIDLRTMQSFVVNI
ncbi:HesA/MoeB/ThiF family protein [Prevotella sp. PINT]|jgi:Dinucleotide-utilizing enzymes involved in molybdopterin and thiamine biosynthesis family 2|uniref:HesA/MoeB/ThiF family protein n=1 Tax=Palleniella intestinalis TaxID=2736291 RepID=UPI001551F69C|nr:HesA/MoeB/ThiF family protein [Palleniella intestinalis]NPD80752.1 HesA/MoeB/ThiF family protein [Palleniella intestinalis]